MAYVKNNLHPSAIFKNDEKVRVDPKQLLVINKSLNSDSAVCGASESKHLPGLTFARNERCFFCSWAVFLPPFTRSRTL